jgi:hypothetical protein
MILRLAFAFGIAAALIPVSLLLGLSAGKSILISAFTGALFLVMAKVMNRLMKK